MTQAKNNANPLGSFTNDWFPKVIADEGELVKLVEVTGSEKAVSDMLANLYAKDRMPAQQARSHVLDTIKQTSRFVPL